MCGDYKYIKKVIMKHEDEEKLKNYLDMKKLRKCRKPDSELISMPV
jgi:hypothetical protein